MKCPYCMNSETKVLDKRETEGEDVTRRRRECLKCGKRFTTYERVEMVDLLVLKKDGKGEQFSREKVIGGMLKACEKRPIGRDKIEKAVDEIEAALRKKNTTEVKSSLIGELVMKKLKKLDKVAYIRFASVYRDFTDITSFHKELKQLLREKER